MDRTKLLVTATATALCLLAAPAGAQTVPAPATVPTGFMIEGILSANVYTTADGMNFVNAAAVPAAVIGFKLSPVAIGLGISFYRGSTVLEDEDSNTRFRDSYTSMLFSPRFEISLFNKSAAEAYLVAGFGVGFNVAKELNRVMGTETQDTDSGVALGGHLGLGGRYFFGGGPFGLGMELGWGGLFINVKDNESDSSTWLKIHNAYAALVGVFVFG